MKSFFPIIALCLLAACGLGGCHQAPPQMLPLPGTPHPAYTITDLGPGTPQDINNPGQVVGDFPVGVLPKVQGSPYFHGCLWDKGKRIEMPTLGGWYSSTVKVSDHGLILGTAAVAGQGIPANSLTRSCLWDGVKLTDLDADPRFHGTSAIHITKSGVVYAASPPQGPQRQFHLWLYPAGFGPGVRRDLGVIGGPKIKPLFINDSGMVAGTWNTEYVRNQRAFHHAFVWHQGDKKWQDLGTFGGVESEPTGLNDADQVIGEAWLPEVPDLRVHAFLWDKGSMRDLGTLPGGNYSCPYALNNKGQVVGVSNFNGGNVGNRPVLWEHGQIKDLTQFIPSGTRWCNMSGATGINDRGQIVGGGAVTDDQPKQGTYEGHAYLLTPRP